jgi:toxin ParE1/3/4
MSRAFDGLWTGIAQRDLRNIITYVARDGYAPALGLLQNIKNQSETLQTQPHRCRAVPELAAINVANYRELIIKPYRLIFRIEGQEVLILGVFDSRRDLEQVLIDRILD